MLQHQPRKIPPRRAEKKTAVVSSETTCHEHGNLTVSEALEAAYRGGGLQEGIWQEHKLALANSTHPAFGDLLVVIPRRGDDERAHWLNELADEAFHGNENKAQLCFRLSSFGSTEGYFEGKFKTDDRWVVLPAAQLHAPWSLHPVTSHEITHSQTSPHVFFSFPSYRILTKRMLEELRTSLGREYRSSAIRKFAKTYLRGGVHHELEAHVNQLYPSMLGLKQILVSGFPQRSLDRTFESLSGVRDLLLLVKDATFAANMFLCLQYCSLQGDDSRGVVLKIAPEQDAALADVVPNKKTKRLQPLARIAFRPGALIAWGKDAFGKMDPDEKRRLREMFESEEDSFVETPLGAFRVWAATRIQYILETNDFINTFNERFDHSTHLETAENLSSYFSPRGKFTQRGEGTRDRFMKECEQFRVALYASIQEAAKMFTPEGGSAGVPPLIRSAAALDVPIR